MKRSFGYAAFTLGWVLIFLAPLFHFYVAPRVAKAPADVYVTTISNGTGSYFSPDLLTVIEHATLKNVSVAKGDPARSTDDVAVIGLFSRTLDVQRGDFDYSYSVDAFGRRTGLAVNCCGATPKAEGLTLKFPFGTKKMTYPYWNGVALHAYPARYERMDKLDGLDAYVFVTAVPPTRTKSQTVPGYLVGEKDRQSVLVHRMYRATTTLWVEPTTGAILKGAANSEQWLADGAGTHLLTLADVRFVTSPESVQSIVDRTTSQLWQLKLVSRWLPGLGPLVGTLLVIIGWKLVRSPQLLSVAPSVDDAAEPAARSQV